MQGAARPDFLGDKHSISHNLLSIVEYFKNFIDDQLIDYISTQNNMYWSQKKTKQLKVKYIDTNQDEIE